MFFPRTYTWREIKGANKSSWARAKRTATNLKETPACYFFLGTSWSSNRC